MLSNLQFELVKLAMFRITTIITLKKNHERLPLTTHSVNSEKQMKDSCHLLRITGYSTENNRVKLTN